MKTALMRLRLSSFTFQRLEEKKKSFEKEIEKEKKKSNST